MKFFCPLICYCILSGHINIVSASYAKIISHKSKFTLSPPQFPGGEPAFREFLGKNLNLPKIGGANTVGIVVVGFFVEKDGSLTGFEIKQSVGKVFDDEALRVLKKSPKWIPAMRDGVAIKSKYSVPIQFFISG